MEKNRAPAAVPVQSGSLRRVALLVLLPALLWLSGCGGGEPAPTRTPVPTWTPTPLVQGEAAPVPAEGQAVPTSGSNEIGAQVVDPAVVAAAIATETPTPLPTDTPTPVPTATPLPTETPTVTATPPPTETPTPAPPTATPVPTATPDYPFTLEVAEKFPTDSLAQNVVRIFAYIYSPTELGLEGYTLSVLHQGTPLVVEEVATAGFPAMTREDADNPYNRFTNLSVIFVEPQAGEWLVQLLDPTGVPVGPEALFTLTADENTRELYVRYRRD